MKTTSPLRFPVVPALLGAALFSSPLRAAEEPGAATSVLVVTGAAGAEEYASTFQKWTSSWKKACAAAGEGTRLTVIGGDAEAKQSREQFQKALEAEPHDSPAPLWLVFLGHGTSDGKDGKFNLTGNDLAASDLATWLRPFHRPVVVVCGFSAGGAFLKPLSGPERVIVTATRSGAENNFSRFGGWFGEALTDPQADLDKDGETSVLEAWLWAAQRVAAFYKDEGRLATEHSLLEDNGDGFGTPPDWFKGVRVVKKPAGARNSAKPDGFRAGQIRLIGSVEERKLSAEARAERDRLEAELAALRENKAGRPEAEYLDALEAVLTKLGALYRN